MRKDKQHRWILAAALIMVSFIGIVIIIGLLEPKENEPIEGMVDLTDYRISSKVPSRVLKYYVVEGQMVHKGDTLVILRAPEINAKLMQAESVQSAAEAQNQKAVNGTRYEQIQGAYDIWQQAKAGLEIAQKTFARVKNLNAEGVLPSQKLDEATAQRDAAIATEKAALSQYQMAINGARLEDKETTKAQVEQAKGIISEVKSYVNETVFTSPVDGQVTEIFPEISELVGTGAPIMNINDINDVWFTFNIREDHLTKLRLNMHTNVYVSALNRTIPVRISRMKDVGSFAVWKATKSKGQFDLKTFEVQARPLKHTEGLLPGMTAILKEK
jgi:HlyD family secretion protein